MRSSDLIVCIRGGGDIGSGVAWRLHPCGFLVCVTEATEPLSVRRKVSFCEAVYDGEAEVEGVRAVLVPGMGEAPAVWGRGEIPVLVDPACESRHAMKPEVLVDAIIAKKNLGTSAQDAPLVIAVGPGKVLKVGQVIAGLAPGRGRPDQITLADLTGTGIQDTAIAALAVARARAAGAGQSFTV